MWGARKTTNSTSLDRPGMFRWWVAASGRLATVALVSHACPSTRGGLAMNICATCSRQPWNKEKLSTPTESHLGYPGMAVNYRTNP